MGDSPCRSPHFFWTARAPDQRSHCFFYMEYHKLGVFSPRRVPYSFAEYFSLSFPSFQSKPPFLAADRPFYDYPSVYSNDFSDVYLSLPWGSPWLIFARTMGNRMSCSTGWCWCDRASCSDSSLSWLIDTDQNVPPETRAVWEKLLERRSLEKWE